MSWSNPQHKVGGGSCRGLQKLMYGRWCLSLQLGRCESLPEVNGQSANPNCELYVGLGSRSKHKRVSLDNELSCPLLACLGPLLNLRLMELELVTKITWKRELGISSGLIIGRLEGHVGDWGRLLWAIGRFGVVSNRALDLRGSWT